MDSSKTMLTLTKSASTDTGQAMSMDQESTATSSGSGTVSLSAEGSTGNMLNSQKMQNLGKKGKTYIVKFADVPVAEMDKKFEIVGVEELLQVEKTKSMEAPKTTDVPEDVQTALEIVTGVTRSKRQVKTPKRLLDMDSTPKKTLKTKEANKISDQDSVLILPRISISNLNKNDLYIEMEIDSEYSVGPLELVSKEREKSKYGIKVTKAVSELKDVVKVDDGNVDEEMDIEHTEGEEIMLRISNIETSDILFETESQKVSSSGKSPKSSKSSQKSPKKQLKKQAVKKKNGPKSASKKKDKEESKTINGDKSDKTQTETQDNETDEIEQTSFPEASDDIDDTVEDDPAVEEERSETGIILKMEQEADEKASQTEIDYESEKLEQKGANASKKSKRVRKKKNPEKKGKKLVDDSKPKRKYTKSSAYNHDNSNYTIVTNDEGQKLHKCNYCGVEIKHRGNMRDHIRTHTGEKPFECETCHKRFANQTSYTIHIACHKTDRPFVCEICGFGFKIKRQLTLHTRRHTSKGTNICQFCGRAFYSSSELKNHMLRHTEEKRYICEVCSKPFAHASSFARHKLTHTESGRYQCHECGDTFIRRVYFKNHLIRKHGIPVESADKLIPKLRNGPLVERLFEEDENEETKEDTSEVAYDLVPINNDVVPVNNDVVPVNNVVAVNDIQLEGKPVYIKFDETNYAVQYISGSEEASTVYLGTIDGTETELGDETNPDGNTYIQIIHEEDINIVGQEEVVKQDLEEMQILVSNVESLVE